MHHDIAVKWVEYLRKPERKQHNGSLGKMGSEERCCLGHLCDIAVTEGVIDPPVPGNREELAYGEAEAAAFLPREVQKWAGMKTNEGVFVGKDIRTLASMNDRGDSLWDIAEDIEQHWGHL